MSWINYLGYLAAILTTSAFIPQAIKSAKTRSTKDISEHMYYLIMVGSLCWALYGFLSSQYSILIANLIIFILTTLTVYLIHKHRK